MSGVIPPFGAKFRMSCMIGWETIDIARKSTTESLFILLALDGGTGTY